MRRAPERWLEMTIALVTKAAQSIRSAARGSAPGGLFDSALAASVKWLPDKGDSDSTRTTGISLASGIPPSLLREVPG
ncbi:MAG: hypothetical protein QOH20_2700 [Mycobacterium sp.]|nr:hypothetical protein [Mycobacterium sp.]